MWRSVVNVAAFQAGWFACILGAAYGRPTVGPLVVLGVVALRLLMARQARSEAVLIVLVGLIGIAVDGVQTRLGVLRFHEGAWLGWLCPLWFVALWPNFATLLNGVLVWLSGRYVLGAALGAVGGPLSYYAGAQLGALSLGESLPVSLSAIGVAWAVVTPVLLWLAARLRRADVTDAFSAPGTAMRAE